MQLTVFMVFTVFTVFMVSTVCTSAYGDYIETMGGGIYHKDNPLVCIMEPEPTLQERFYGSPEGIDDISDGILTLTIETIYEWSSTMRDYTDGSRFHDQNGWHMETALVKYEDHNNLMVFDYPECNIFIEYSKENTGQHIKNESALGYTQMDFSKSKHQWAYVMIYLDSIEIGQKVHLCIGCDDQEQKLELKVDLDARPMPVESIHKILRHEFGHAIGIGHYIEDQSDGNNVDSLMYPNFNPFKPKVYDTIPLADREILRQIYGNDGFGGFQGYPDTRMHVLDIVAGALEHVKSKLQ